MQHSRIFIFTLIITVLISCSKDSVKPTYLNMGTGGKYGLYYPVGKLLARYGKVELPSGKIEIIKVHESQGSDYNMEALNRGEFDVALVQSDRAALLSSKYPGVRVILSLHLEEVVLLVSNKSKIASIHEIIGKKINLGSVGSGPLENSKDILNIYNIQLSKITPTYLNQKDAIGLLQDGKIDGLFFTAGHPNPSVSKSLINGAKIIPLKVSDAELMKYPYYKRSIIKKDAYIDLMDKDVETVAVTALLLVSHRVSSEWIRGFLLNIVKNFKEIKEVHPIFKNLTLKDLAPRGEVEVHLEAKNVFSNI